MDKTKVKHVFFDLDNTLWDHRGNSEVTLKQMFQDYKIVEKYNVDFDTWHDAYYEHNEFLWAELREGHITKQELRDRRFSEPFTKLGVTDNSLGQIFEDEYLTRMGKMNGTCHGAKELLEYLAPKYTIHIITNGFVEVSKDKLVNVELDSFVATLTCADEINLRKPDPRIFDLASSKAQSTKGETIIIGDDWIADVLGGTGYGWQAIYYNTLNDSNHLDEVPNVLSLLEIKDLL